MSVNESVELLIKCVQVQFFATQESGSPDSYRDYFVAKNCVSSIASNPPFLKHRQALMRYRQPYGDSANIKLTDKKLTLTNITDK